MELAEQRRMMVERQLRGRGIYDERVLAAMLEIPREEFMPESSRKFAYADDPAPIGYGQTISQPYMVALMAQCLELEGTETVLEVGGGCGYHAAVLAAVAARVISMELIAELAELAQQNLEKTGRGGNVLVVCGDGAQGCPALAPFEAISVAAAAEQVPPALLEQLKDGGRLVIPVGGAWDQELRVIHKQGGEITSRVATYCRFVPLR
jgi:protein-L-isoaspartate(D-aspartate) O-methyltransferase